MRRIIITLFATLVCYLSFAQVTTMVFSSQSEFDTFMKGLKEPSKKMTRNKYDYQQEFLNNTFRYSIEMTMGSIRDFDSSMRFSLGVSFIFYGIYCDIMIPIAAHGGSMDIGKWNETRAYSWHIGYSIPVIKGLSISPVLGQHIVQNGYTDGSYYHFSQDGTVNNLYIIKEQRKNIDYGAIISYNFWNCKYYQHIPIILSFECLRSGIYFGIGFSMGKME